MKATRFWWIKVVGLIIALAGVIWAQCTLQEDTHRSSDNKLEQIEPIPAKIEVGK